MTKSTDSRIADEARDWLVRLTSGDVTERDLSAFKLWLAQSASHEAAFDRERSLWQELSALEPAFAVLESADQKVQPTRESQGISTASRFPARPGTQRRLVSKGRAVPRLDRWRMRPFHAVALAACLLVACVGLIAGPNLAITLKADHHTGFAEVAALTLPDGSQVTLNRNSALEVLFSDAKRQVRVLRGEAYFEVASNPDRPFEVLAGEGGSRAVGTAYAVRRTDRGVRVVVTEGQVAVSGHSQIQAQTQISAALSAGQAVRYDASGTLGEVYELSEDVALAWRRGRFVFVRQPLSDVIATLQNYHQGRIAVLSGNLDQEVSGSINLDSLTDGLSALAATQDLSVFEISPFLTVVR
ncbi:FecR family protein [Rhodovibrionaceae bacterium A322]